MSDDDEIPYEDDEIANEIDVFINDKLDLYLLQLPLKPSYMSELAIQSAKYKPECNKLEIEGGNGIPTLQSSNVPKTSNLAFGVMKNNALHITPIHEILQLRPSFANLKKNVDDSTAMEVDDGGDDDDDDDDTTAPRESVKQVLHQVQMKRKESERTQNYRRRSYMHAKQREDAEQWRPLGVHAMNSSASQQKFQELYFE